MRIAVISDIHANLPALEEVLNGIDSQKVNAIYCLGDLVNQNVWNNEVVEIIRKRKIPTIKGNHDEGIGEGRHFFPFSYTFSEAKQWGKEAIEYTLSHITDDNRSFLSELPLHLRLKITGKDGTSFSIVLTHGSPKGINEKMYHFSPKKDFAELLKLADADMLLMGNTHAPYHHIIQVEENGCVINRHVINPGSVGKPKDGDWRPSYVLLTIDPSKPLLIDPEAIHVDFYRIKYDLGKAVKAIKNSGLPVYYGGCLITG